MTLLFAAKAQDAAAHHQRSASLATPFQSFNRHESVALVHRKFVWVDNPFHDSNRDIPLSATDRLTDANARLFSQSISDSQCHADSDADTDSI